MASSGARSSQILPGSSMAHAIVTSAPADSLGPTTTPSRRLLWDDLPEEWKTPVPAKALADYAARTEVHAVLPAVCVELPDFPWPCHYTRWAQQPVAQVRRTGDPLPVVVVAEKTSEASLTKARDRLCRHRCCSLCRWKGGHCFCSRQFVYTI